MSKGLIYLSIFICSTAGAYIPTWFGAGFFSIASIIGSIAGGLAGIWLAIRAQNYI